MPSDSDELAMCMAEYTELKREQNARIGARDNLVYATLASVAGVVVYGMSTDGSPVAFLALPLATFVLGSLALSNDAKVSAIADYIRTNLSVRVGDFLGKDSEDVFVWERVIRKAHGRIWRKGFELVANLIVFVLPGLFGIRQYMVDESPITWPFSAVISVDGIVLLALTIRIASRADLRGDRARGLHRENPKDLTAIPDETRRPPGPD